MKPPLSLVPLLPCTFMFISGILIAGIPVSAWWAIVLIALAGVLALRRLTYQATLALSLCLGFTTAKIHEPQQLDSSLTTSAERYCGVAVERHETESSQLVILKIDSIGGHKCRQFTMSITIPMMIPDVALSDRVAFTTIAQIPESKTDLPDEIDYTADLIRKGVVATAFVEPDSIHSVVPAPGIIHEIKRLRRRLTRLIATSPFDSNTVQFLNTTLTGDASLLDKDTRILFSSTGLAHILALSGLHVGLLTWLIVILLTPLWLVGFRWLRNILIIVALWIFAIMTGLSPSVVRAVTMATLFLAGGLLQRVRSPLNSLCFAAIVILLFSPESLYSIGFQLSFIAVASIILVANKLNWVDRRNYLTRKAVGLITVSIAAMLGTGIASVYYFHIFPLYFLPVNIIAVVLLPFIMGGAVVVLIFNAAGIEIIWLGKCVDLLYGIIEGTAGFFAELPGALTDIYLHPLPTWLIVITIAFSVAWLHYRRPVLLLSAMTTLLTAVITSIMLAPQFPESELYITRNTRSTEMLIKDGNRMWLYTTAHEQDFSEVKSRCDFRYRDYMGRRKIDSISILPPRYADTVICRNRDIVKTGNTMFKFIHDNAPAEFPSVDYAVVCRGFRGDIVKLAALAHADTILLSHDLDSRRHNRYMRELKAAGIPHRSLRFTSFQMCPLRAIHDNRH